MDINIWAVLACVVLSLVGGMVWYGPFMFGKKWMEINGITQMMLDARKDEMNKQMMRLMGVQTVLSLFQVYVLAHYIKGWNEASGIENALWLYGAFVIPTLAGAIMWSNESSKNAWARFWIQAGYQLVMFVVFGYVLKMWA